MFRFLKGSSKKSEKKTCNKAIEEPVKGKDKDKNNDETEDKFRWRDYPIAHQAARNLPAHVLALKADVSAGQNDDPFGWKFSKDEKAFLEEFYLFDAQRRKACQGAASDKAKEVVSALYPTIPAMEDRVLRYEPSAPPASQQPEENPFLPQLQRCGAAGNNLQYNNQAIHYGSGAINIYNQATICNPLMEPPRMSLFGNGRPVPEDGKFTHPKLSAKELDFVNTRLVATRFAGLRRDDSEPTRKQICAAVRFIGPQPKVQVRLGPSKDYFGTEAVYDTGSQATLLDIHGYDAVKANRGVVHDRIDIKRMGFNLHAVDDDGCGAGLEILFGAVIVCLVRGRLAKIAVAVTKEIHIADNCLMLLGSAAIEDLQLIWHPKKQRVMYMDEVTQVEIKRLQAYKKAFFADESKKHLPFNDPTEGGDIADADMGNGSKAVPYLSQQAVNQIPREWQNDEHLLMDTA